MDNKEFYNELDTRIEMSDSPFMYWVKEQLDNLNEKDDLMQSMMNRHLLRMCYIFDDEGHSGFSAGYAINALYRLLKWKPLKALTEDDSEWNDIDDSGETQQNKYCSSCFRDRQEDGSWRYTDNDKYAFTEDGSLWFGTNPKRFGLSDEIEMPYYPPINAIRVYLKDDKVEKIVEG